MVEGEEKIIDLLVEVQQAGQETTFLVHIEAQASSQANFNRRMFHYFARLHQRHLKNIYPIVVFSFDEPLRSEKNSYKVEFPHLKVLEFRFHAIQLNRLNWRDYIDRPNPVAAALMAKMKIAKQDRAKVKAECLRLLVTLKLNPAKTRLVSRFVDTYLRLDFREERAFQAEIDKIGVTEREEIMEILTSWEEKGLEKGLEKGREEERRAIALNMLRKNLPLETIAEVTGITIAQLQQLQSQANP